MEDHVSQALQALAHRRQKRIVAWLEANVEHVAGEGDAQRLVMVAKTVLARQSQLSKS